MKYPIGIQSFEQIINDGYVYVDKTDLVYQLTLGKIYFLSRPRRFGKSLLVSTLENYYLGKKELFKGLKIDALEKEWKTYPVFHLDFNGKNYNDKDALIETLTGFVEEQEAQYGRDPYHNSIGDRFAYVLKSAHQQTGYRCVVLIDEYDKPLLDVMDLPEKIRINNVDITLEENHRNILKAFYSTFKLADADLQFVLLTGVTKFSQISVFSGFNQPNDISMDNQFDALCGITDDELEFYFKSAIQELADNYGYSYEEMHEVLRRQFDGYHFGNRLKGVYNPFSILNTFFKMDIRDYWFRTGTPTYLVRLLQDSNENLNDLTGKYYDESEFVDYRADKEKPLPMIYQSGYLTIKDWNMDTDSYLLDFPNDEVRSGFLTLVASSYLKPSKSTDAWIIQVVDVMSKGDYQQLENLMTSFFASIPYNQRRKDDEREKERYFQYTFYLVLRMISCFTVFIEKQQSEGRVDCVVETPNYIYIFEFKRDGSAEEALKQIEDMGYAREYAADGRKIYQIGCNFSSKTGTIDGWKVK